MKSRYLLALLLILTSPIIASAANSKPAGRGSFRDNTGVVHKWYINDAGTLIWDGKPYLPAGGMFLSYFLMDFNPVHPAKNEASYKVDVQRLKALKAAGVTDIYLNPCMSLERKPVWVWQKFIDLCDSLGIRYGIQVTEETDQLKVFETGNDQYTIDVNSGDIASLLITHTLITQIKPESRVYYAAFDQSTGKLVDAGTALVTPAKNGINAEVKPNIPTGTRLTVRFTPEIILDGGVHDYWHCINADFKKTLRQFFSTIKPGKGFRLWIDPLDNEQSFSVIGDRLMPNSDDFRKAYANYLKQKYGNKGELIKAWAISNTEACDYPAFARMIPLNRSSAAAGDGYLFDPMTGKAYKYDQSKSSIWSDMLYFRDNSVSDFNCEIANLIKSYHDAPVVLKHEGSDLFRNRRTHGGFDGLGAESYGTDLKHLRETSASVHAQSQRCGRTMWELTTETGPAESYIGYKDPLDMINQLASMLEMGGKGTYCFLFKEANKDPRADWYTFNLTNDPRQLYWVGCYARMIQSSPALVNYTPGKDVKMESGISPDFMKRVLGVRVLNLGPSFQALTFHGNTYIWNLSDTECILGLDGNAGSSEALVYCSDGKYIKACKNASTLLTLKARAEAPAIIRNCVNPVITGVEEANYSIALDEWRTAQKKLASAGLSVKQEPDSKDWRSVYTEAEKMKQSAGDIFAPQMTDVKVDGNLNEWSKISTINLKQTAEIDASRFDGAKLKVGYDKNYIYLAGEITDQSVVNKNRLGKLWDGDAIEVFLDLDPYINPSQSAYTNNCYQFIFAPTSEDGKPGAVMINPQLQPDHVPSDYLFAASTDESGWRFELAVSRKDLNGFELSPGRTIGFEIQLDNSDGEERVWSKMWHGREDAFMNRSRFGRLLLGGPVR